MIRAAFLVLAAALALPVFAQTPLTTTTVFTALDEARVTYQNTTYLAFQVTGVVEGEAAASSRSFSLLRGGEAEFCEKAVLLMLERPGRYRLTVVSPGNSAGSCKLSRTTP
jgi:hypothetical protein